MPDRQRPRHARLMCGAALVALALATSAHAQGSEGISIAPQALDTALNELGSQSNQQVMIRADIAAGKMTRGVTNAPNFEAALVAMLDGTGLVYRREGSTYLVVSASDPQSGSAAGDGADGTVQALIVTAQKREEDIQDVPIAISAFTQEDLTRSQVAGGPDLMTQVPNFTFTKTNFSGYSIQIRGIGTQAISATTDPAVAVAFNNTPFIRNRFFEQEFYDLQRVEVLRGPQGTLYGRNATGGVVNIISAKPSFHYEAKASADLANFNTTRLEGMVNLPLVEDKVAFRLAGAWTKRDGYATNQITGNPIDGRDLWSTRLSLRFEPTDTIHANLVWEHFQEDDDRLRSGKQLCHTDVPTEIAGMTTVYQGGSQVPLAENPALPDFGFSSGSWSGVQGVFSQGCGPASLYAPESFQTPNGFAIPYYLPLGAVFLPIALDDPYASRTQSRDLRVIESTIDPQYRAKSDLAELQVSFDITDRLTLTSETGYNSDFLFSLEDYNRFNTSPGAWDTTQGGHPELVARGILSPEGVYCDPQLGCSDRLVAVDVSTARSRQFSQEFRLSSNFEGGLNFSLGANFLRYDTEDKYYVFINSLGMFSAISPYGHVLPLSHYQSGVTDNLECLAVGMQAPDALQTYPVAECTYIDPNPIGSLNDRGHNYFLSRNPYKLISYAVFGEAYYQITDNLKLTGGLRWTVDKKQAPQLPSWLLGSDTVGLPTAKVIEQEWREPTGRLTLDWKPDISLTDETLLYASYAHGYKAGGANPPPYGIATYTAAIAPGDPLPPHPETFEPEFVNAFEVGTKNTLMDGRLTMNANAFYYDYTGYQISQIIDRSAVNYNFDSKVWGLEFEGDWRPLENLRLGLKLGYEKTRVADGMSAIDIMDRTAGHQGWVVVRPFPSIPSNCILPAWLFLGDTGYPGNPELVGLGALSGGSPGGCEWAYVYGEDPGPHSKGHDGVINYTAFSTDPADFPGWPTGVPITDRTYPGWDPSTAPNNGQGFAKDLSGHELPNAPHITATFTTDYTLPLPNDWLATLHTDFYYQSEAWTRIFNTPGYDRLKAYTNVNLAAIFSNEDAGWKVMAYVKNLFNRDSITGAFLNSDDTGLTTNVFLTEPRLYGLRITKEWTGNGWWTGANPNHPAGEPYPLTIELGGQVQRVDAPYAFFAPSFIDQFSSTLTPTGLENRDLDHGDNWEMKVAYRPTGSSWQVSGGLRFGRTNNDTGWFHAEEVGDTACGFAGYFAYVCPIYEQKYGRSPNTSVYNFSDASEKDREEHLLADFEVGHDVGLGAMGLSHSSLGAGLRYAQFKSNSQAWIRGIPNWDLADGWALARFFNQSKYPSTADQFEANVSVEREFKGVGPTLNWDAARPLLGSDASGHLNLEWDIRGGVLFGKQKTDMSGTESDGYFKGFYGWVPRPLDVTTTPIDVHRSKSVSVPVVDLSLGLAYEIQRIKVGAGYRWERYFNVLDAGADEHESFDRTLDGPYFRIAVGFGG